LEKSYMFNNTHKIRFLLFAAIILIISSSIFSYVFLHNDFLIRKWNLPLDPPGFFDSRQFAWASESYALGYDQLYENPVNPRGTLLNYPRIWHLLFLLGINESHTNLLGSIVVILFFFGLGIFWFSGKFDNLTCIALFLVILSPPVMLGVERSNIELIIFFMLSLVLVTNSYSSVSGLFIFLFAAILKLHPIFGIPYLLREDKKKFWILFFMASGIFLLYTLLSLTDFIQLFKTAPRGVSSSFGRDVWWMALKHRRFYNLSLSSSLVSFFKILSYIFALTSVAVTLYLSMQKKDCELCKQLEHIVAFRMGSGIYIGCFLLMNTVDYRLVFLIFTIPQIVAWMRNSDKRISLIPRITFAAMMFSLWSDVVMRFLGRKITFPLETFSNWIVLTCLLYLLFSSLPEWLSDDVRRLFLLKKRHITQSVT
jgi:hypothetical protein